MVPPRLPALIEAIEEQTVQLRVLATRSTTALLGDPVALAAAKYFFVVAIEASIDAARHVALAHGLRSAVNFADAFVVLGESGHLDLALVERWQDMARFRNLLVHGYTRVDNARVIEILQTRLGDLDDFRRQVAHAVTD